MNPAQRSRRATIGGSTAGIAVGWQVGNVAAAAEPLADAYGSPLAAIGLLTTALFATHIATQIPGGRLIDRIGARPVAFAGTVLIAVGSALALAAPTLALGIVSRAVCGVGTGLLFIAAVEYIRASGGSALAQGIFGGFNLSAGGLALALIPQLDGGLGWRAPFVSALVVTAMSFAILLACPADRPRARPLAGEQPAPLRPAGLLRLAAMHTASFGLNVVVSSWVVAFLARAGDYSHAAAGAIGALTLVAGILTRPLGGYVARRWPQRTRAVVAASLALGALATGLLAWAGPMPVMAVASFLVGFAAGIPFAPAFAAAARARPETPALSVAFVNASAGVAILGLTPLIGLTFSLPGEGRIGILVAAGLWAATLLALPGRELLGAGGSQPEHASSPR